MRSRKSCWANMSVRGMCWVVPDHLCQQTPRDAERQVYKAVFCFPATVADRVRRLEVPDWTTMRARKNDQSKPFAKMRSTMTGCESSNAPMSVSAPKTRGWPAPRWSLAKWPGLLPWSIARLSAASAWVGVGPP